MAHPRTIARLEARIQQRAAHCLEFEISDPRAEFITITKVELATDLSSGKIFYSLLGTESDRNKVARMLEDAGGYIQRKVASVLRVRRMPRLNWHYDDSVEYAAEMDEKIAAALKRDRKIQEAGAAEGDEAESSEPERWELEYDEGRDELSD